MRFIKALLAWIVPIASARIQTNNTVVPDEMFLIETAPGQTQWVTSDEKWELRRKGHRFMDITTTQDLGTMHTAAKEPVIYPWKCTRGAKFKGASRFLNPPVMRKNLEKLTSFHTRYYDSVDGDEASKWVFGMVECLIKEYSLGGGVSVKSFDHPWKQSSVIATIAGQTEDTIVIGAHLDSVNLRLPALAAPGADDGGSGTITIMDVFRALLLSPNIQRASAINTIEFHWYSAEEGGLLGSQAIFKEYEKKGRVIKAMLQQDMVGYIKGTLDVGLAERIGVVVDHVDDGLTRFMKTVIEHYCTIPWVETKCGFPCSDHASAFKAGYPTALVMESSFENSNQLIHNSSDLIENVSIHHMLEHAKMTLGFVFELAFYGFPNQDLL